MKLRILLSATESWPSAALYADGFATAGCDVIAHAPAAAPVHTSPFITAASVYRPLAPIRSLEAAIAQWTPDLVVSCDERALAHLLRLYFKEPDPDARVLGLIARSVGVPENYRRVLSRSASLADLKALGVCIPDTFEIEGERDLERCVAAVGFPAVLKADESWGGDGVIIVHSLDEARVAWRKLAHPVSRLRSLVRAMRRRDVHFLLAAMEPKSRKVSVQRFVKGELGAAAFATRKGKVAASFCYAILESHEAGMGPPKLVRRIDCPEMEEAVRLAASHFGLSGAHGLDFIRDEDGVAHLIEINPRATQGGTLPFGFGRDIPHGLVSAFSHGHVGIRNALKSEVVEFYPRPDDPSRTFSSASERSTMEAAE
jgi:formate-dependent phosphoribosylglycinamide formyltransferase (GAR transformylase)